MSAMVMTLLLVLGVRTFVDRMTAPARGVWRAGRRILDYGYARPTATSVTPASLPPPSCANRLVSNLARGGALAGFWPLSRGPLSTTLASQLTSLDSYAAPFALSSSSNENSRWHEQVELIILGVE